MKKYLLAILIIIILSAGVIVGLILVQQQQIFKQKASTSAGTATVSLQPASQSFERNTPYPVKVYFNTGNISVSGVQAQLTFSNLSVKASGIQINPDLLSSGDWSCPVKSISDNGAVSEVDISCINTSTAGYSNSADTLLATFNLTASEVPIVNPLIVSFNAANTIITQKSDATDIALTPISTGSYTITDTIAQTPSPVPTTIVASPTATPTTNPNATATPTAAPTAAPTTTPTATPTTVGATTTATIRPTNPPIPVTGFDTPTIIGGVAGIMLLLIAGIALIL